MPGLFCLVMAVLVCRGVGSLAEPRRLQPASSPTIPPGTQWAREQLEAQAEEDARRPRIPDKSGCNETARDVVCPRELSRCLIRDPTSSSYEVPVDGQPRGPGVCDCYSRNARCIRDQGCEDFPFALINFCENVLLCPAGKCDGSRGFSVLAATPTLALATALITALAQAIR